MSGGAAAHFNRMHFLAGRRSWRIGEGKVFDPDLKDDVIILETAAVERFSSRAYRTADAVIGLQNKVPDIWIAFLNNFVNKQGLPVFVQTLKPGWKRKHWANYLQLSFESFAQLRAAREYGDLYKLYPTLDPARALEIFGAGEALSIERNRSEADHAKQYVQTIAHVNGHSCMCSRMYLARRALRSTEPPCGSWKTAFAPTSARPSFIRRIYLIVSTPP